MRILLLEPYCGGSHRAWAEGYAAHSRHDVTLLTLPGRFWKWRMQGGALTLAERARALPARPDLVLASDMLNLPAFLALSRDVLAGVPAVLYCHENQLTYPCSPGEKRDLTYGMINWLSMLAADRVYFNSRYHLEEWFDELPRLLKHLPDYVHLHRIADVQARSGVLPVGCDLHRLDPTPTLRRSGAPPAAERGTAGRHTPGLEATIEPSQGLPPLHRLDPAPTLRRSEKPCAAEQGTAGRHTPGLEATIEPSQGFPPLILWNQRWEYDKDPETFFRALFTLADEGLDFRVALAGKSHRRTAPEFEMAQERLGARVVHFGYADEARYGALLRQAALVVSTAVHEFFGIAVVEAIYCGCCPVLPCRLAYPELIPEHHHAACLYEDFEGLLAHLRRYLAHPDHTRALAADLRPAVARFDWSEMCPRYDEEMEKALFS